MSKPGMQYEGYEATMEAVDRPLNILAWGGMGTIQRALFAAPEITGKIRVLTIAANLMADNPDSRESMNSMVQNEVENVKILCQKELKRLE